MKTVKRGGEVRRLSDVKASDAVRFGLDGKVGWVYCPKSEWKKQHPNRKQS